MIQGALLALAVAMSLVPGSWFFYALTVQQGSAVQIYYYNFTVVSVNQERLVFNLTITYPNGTSQTSSYSAPLSKPYPFPFNGTAFYLTNMTYEGIKDNVSIYHGTFRLDGYSVPVTAYYFNGLLSNYSGTLGNVRVVAVLESSYVPPTSGGLVTDLGAWLIVIILLGAIVIGVIVLARIGKI